MVGHCEFGRDNRFVNTGHATTMLTIRSAWDGDDRARAFGLYWAEMYGQVLDLVARDEKVRDAVLFIRYEDLCGAPNDTMARIIGHAQLDESERRVLHATTHDIAARLGY